ncbi:type II secretion system F family protein [Demequina pelophila]|uniref:type II secretion system F family protein n=1 Tax=Demequina pelophila TaxID=1638984 RepID=UPI000783C275|nr:type II secretion system F family protein [Demequina pelophila]
MLPRVEGLLRAGLTPEEAWRRAGVAVPGDDARDPVGAAVAACGRLSATTGAPLGAMLAAVAAAAADAREAAAVREAALAGPRLSARLLQWLPLLGIGLAALVEPRALGVFATPVGWGLLGVAGVLALAARRWTSRLVASASLPSDHAEPIVGAALLRAVLASGADVPGALDRVGEAMRAPPLREAAAALRTGSEAVDSLGPGWEPVTRALGAAWAAGAAPGPALEAAARGLARRARTDAAVAAGEIGVKAALPLALCQLPAFVLVGIVPLLVATVGSLALW